MRVTREEVDAMRRETAKDRPKMWPEEMRRPYAEPQILQQAKVATEHLTGTPEWDVFLQRVQAFVVNERATLLAAMEATLSPSLTTEQIQQAHRQMLAMKAKIEAWETVLRLPNAIMESATQATAA